MSADSKDVDDVYSLNAKITSQGSTVRALKKGGGSAEEIAAEVAKLLELRAQLAALEALTTKEEPFNRSSFDQLMLRKMYIVPAFEIHNGPAVCLI
jgi:glycyl-tRNA synthetase